MYRKKYEELTFTDDFMFCKVMENNLGICRQILELILDIRIKEIVVADRQKEIDVAADSKGIRLDVYLEDDQDTVYNIEMQTSYTKGLPMRTRYYQGLIDMNLLEKGVRYSQLRTTFIIFICLRDLFEKDLPVYTFENVCREQSEVKLGDRAYKVFVNAACTRENIPRELYGFLKYLRTGEAEGKLTSEIQADVIKNRKHDEWKVEYMTWNMMKELVYDEGKEAGIQEGKKTEKRKAIQRLIQKGFAKEMILELGYTKEEYEEARQLLL